MRVDWCQNHRRQGDCCEHHDPWLEGMCDVVPSLVIPVADMEGLLADLRTYEDGSPLAYPTWGGDRLAELIGGDDE